MKVDEDIIEEAMKAGMPPKPLRENFSDDETFEEYYGYWMSNHGRTLALRQQIKNANKNKV